MAEAVTAIMERDRLNLKEERGVINCLIGPEESVADDYGRWTGSPRWIAPLYSRYAVFREEGISLCSGHAVLLAILR